MNFERIDLSEKATLYRGDCLEVLPTLEAGSVDAVITDPPYSSGGAFRSDRVNGTTKKYFGNSPTATQLPEVVGDNRDALGWAFWATLWASRCFQVTKPGGFCMMFSDWRQLPNATNVVQAAGLVWRGIAVWDKGSSVRPMAGRFAHQAEFVIWATNGAIGWDFEKYAAPGVFALPTVPPAHKQHQTEKPIEVMLWLMSILPTDAVVLDPFMGSGTTGVACARTGRRFIGIEIDANYFETARQRITEALAQPPLFHLEATETQQQLGFEEGI